MVPARVWERLEELVNRIPPLVENPVRVRFPPPLFNVIPPVPDVKVTLVAPVELPSETVLAVASVPILIPPVFAPPIVKFWELVVCISPATLLNVILPLVVALPLAPNIWNLALAVELPPIARSLTVLDGAITLDAS